MKIKVLTLLCLVSAQALLAAQHNTLTEEEIAAGYELLFDGEDFNNSHWVDYKQGVENNTGLDAGWKFYAADSAFGKDAEPSDIRSRKAYKDFELRFSFRTNGNSGIYYRETTAGREGWETGVEFAIDDDTTIRGWFCSGAAYELIPPAVSNYAGSNKWNSAKIIAVGDSVEHWMNGEKIAAYRYWDSQWDKALTGRLYPPIRSKWNGFSKFCRPAGSSTGYIPEGYIGLQGGHKGSVRFRDIKIAPMAQWASAIGEPKAKAISAREALLNRITVRQARSGFLALHLDFIHPYEAAVKNFLGRPVIQAVYASEPRILNLDQTKFRSGIYIVQIKVDGFLLSKTIALK
jgi:hypothetical protein